MLEADRLKIAVPNGKFERDILGFLQDIGLSFTSGNKRFIRIENMPVDFVVMNPNNIPDFVLTKDSALKAGIAPSSAIWEAGMAKKLPRVASFIRPDLQGFLGIDKSGREFGDEVPLYFQRPQAQTDLLFIGVKKSFSEVIEREKQRRTRKEDLKGESVVTTYPKIACEILTDKGLSQVPIFEKGEAIPQDYVGLVGTIKRENDPKRNEETDLLNRNEVDVLEIFHQVTVNMIKANGKLSRRDIEILGDLKNRIENSMQLAKYGV